MIGNQVEFLVSNHGYSGGPPIVNITAGKVVRVLAIEIQTNGSNTIHMAHWSEFKNAFVSVGTRQQG